VNGARRHFGSWEVAVEAAGCGVLLACDGDHSPRRARRGILRGMRLGMISFLASVAGGCADPNCACAQPGVYIAADAVHVAALSLTGPGCETASVRSTLPTGAPSPPGLIAVSQQDGFVAGAHSYSISGRAEGSCLVVLTFADGSVGRRAYAVRYEGGTCCAGYYFGGDDTLWSLR
jgi:hypothetical protein